jgi:hypothetical protein
VLHVDAQIAQAGPNGGDELPDAVDARSLARRRLVVDERAIDDGVEDADYAPLQDVLKEAAQDLLVLC